MTDDPLISVVVSTYNRPGRLARLLCALAEQTLPAERFEVIVVDNGSGPETGRVLAAQRAAGRLVLRGERRAVTLGPAGGRNAGWRLARAPLVAFTDDDCRPTPGWLEAMMAACATHPGAVIQGPTRPDPGERDRDGWLSHSVSIERLGPQYETCNIVYPRALLERLGGFDESFGLRPAGEDTDLAWRAIESGARTAFAPDALVLHAVERVGARGRLAIAARWGPVVRVLAEHPGSRAMLHRGRFWNVWHYLLWRSVVATAGPAWLRRLVLARHVSALRDRARREGAGSAAIPWLLVHDAVECAAIARAAIRYRTLVL
jgi:glycosyltransferase involved in cell wall biosynthesis